jgi:predicted ATP-dependent endonuclease of OLD family
VRVTLKNFVTYTSAEFFPGPNMNLVIGPNGSGKSTIVCAICLGLGYSPNVLGRATAVGDFVQHGKDSAEIEIELAEENDKSVVIKRRIKKDKNLSTYWLNGMSHSDCFNGRKIKQSFCCARTYVDFQHSNRQFMVSLYEIVVDIVNFFHKIALRHLPNFHQFNYFTKHNVQ